jgi:hypothetical protein
VEVQDEYFVVFDLTIPLIVLGVVILALVVWAIRRRS